MAVQTSWHRCTYVMDQFDICHGTTRYTSWPGLSGPPEPARCRVRWPGDPSDKSGGGRVGHGGNSTPLNIIPEIRNEISAHAQSIRVVQAAERVAQPVRGLAQKSRESSD